MIEQPAKKESLFEYWENYLLGIRKGFGDEGDLLRVAKYADGRPLSVRVIPVIVLLVFVLLHLILFYNALLLSNGSNTTLINMGGMLLRIFVFDYLIFIFAALSGLDSCRRWRQSVSRIEELSLTPLMPSVVGKSMFIGVLRWWLLVCLLFACFEIGLGLPLYASLVRFTIDSDTSILFNSYLFILFVISFFCGPFILGYFHFESSHLAHWMFSQHALPKSKLVSVGIQNFFIINIIVMLLSGFGSVLTLVFLLILFVLPSVLLNITNDDVGLITANIFGSYFAWYVSALPATLIITFLKSKVIGDFESRFTRSWLLYQWWGAGEMVQPPTYPRSYRQALPFWTLHFLALEERNQGVPERKQRYIPRYDRAVEALRNDVSEQKQNELSKIS